MDPITTISAVAGLIGYSDSLAKTLKLIKGDVEIAKELTGMAEEASICVEVLQDTYAIIARYPDAILPASKMMLENCSRQEDGLSEDLRMLREGFTRKTFSRAAKLTSAGSLGKERLAARVNSFKASVMMLRQVVTDSATIYLLEGAINARSFPANESSGRYEGTTTAERYSLNVTIAGGFHNDKAIWVQAHAYQDTLCSDNWVTRKLLERSDKNRGSKFLNEMVHVDPPEMANAWGGGQITPKFRIQLRWFWGSISPTKDSWFFVEESEKELLDMLIGHKLIDELNREEGIAAPVIADEVPKDQIEIALAARAEKLPGASAKTGSRRQGLLDKIAQEKQDFQASQSGTASSAASNTTGPGAAVLPSSAASTPSRQSTPVAGTSPIVGVP